MNIENQKSLIDNQYSIWSNSESPKVGIPHIIHQIWLGSKLPEQYLTLAKTLIDNNPTWEYKLWDEKAILELPNFSNKNNFIKIKNLGVKSDIARYEILRQFGGFYFDTDFRCLKSLSPLADSSTFLTSIHVHETYEIGNAFIASIPHHPLIESICNTIKPVKTSEMMDIINSSGPGFLTNFLVNKIKSFSPTDVVLPFDYFYPIPNTSISLLKDEEEIKKLVTKNTYGIHYWEQSWFADDFYSWFERKCRRALKKILRIFNKKVK